MTLYSRLARGLPIARGYRRSSGLLTQALGVVRDGGQPPIPPDLIPSDGAPGAASSPAPDTSLARAQRNPFWQKVGIWNNVPEAQFLKYDWQKLNTIQKQGPLLNFLENVLPGEIPPSQNSKWNTIKTRTDFLEDVKAGMGAAPMATKLSPHILSVVDWSHPLDDPVRRQFIPMASQMLPDHPNLSLDSLKEKDDQPVNGLVHRYPSKVLFLATSICPVYCRFCTRSYAVGQNTDSVKKATLAPGGPRLEKMLNYIESHPQIEDVVVSGGDAYLLQPVQFRYIGERLLSIPHIRRFRFASKGLAVCPERVVDELDKPDSWTDVLIDLSNRGRELGKEVALHTHFNHPNEINWVTEIAARHLFNEGVTVRNQTVLLRHVNADTHTMSTLIHGLANLNIIPYYVYQADMVRGIEDFRTPLSTILRLQKEIQGTIGGHMLPEFIVDLPGGGGKRNAHSFETYDEESGVSTWTAPAVAAGKTFMYYDPVKED